VTIVDLVSVIARESSALRCLGELPEAA